MKALYAVGLVLAALFVLPWDTGIMPGPMFYNTTATAADQPLDETAHTRRVLQFPCSGVMCQAWLYLPKNTQEKPPVVLAAHGVGCQKDFGLAAYGDRFARAGLASFIFDYRTFGGSEGIPRHWASPSRHCEDYVSAVKYIKASLSDQVDINRISLWGYSLSGGHVLALAGTQLRDNVTAVVAVVPLADGMAFIADRFKRRPLVAARIIVAGIHDALRSLFNYPPAYIPLTGERGSFSLLDIITEDAKAFYDLHPKERQGGWRNQIRGIIALELAYSPIAHAHHIRAPVLYLGGTHDRVLPLELLKQAADKTPDSRTFIADAGHFSIHSGVRFSLVVEQMVDFLKHTNGMQHVSTSSVEAAEHGSPRKDAEDSSANLGARKRDDVHEGWEAAGDAAAEL